MHTAIHEHIAVMTTDTNGFVTASHYKRDLDVFVRTATRFHAMIQTPERVHASCIGVLCMAATNMHGQAGYTQQIVPADAPHIPLDACIDEIFAIVPDGDGADIYIQVSREDILQTSFDAVMRISQVGVLRCDWRCAAKPTQNS